MARFLGIAIGSACEVESQLYVINRLGLLETVATTELLEVVDTLKRRLISLRGQVVKGGRKASSAG
jgi:four helix bundle protein